MLVLSMFSTRVCSFFGILSDVLLLLFKNQNILLVRCPQAMNNVSQRTTTDWNVSCLKYSKLYHCMFVHGLLSC